MLPERFRIWIRDWLLRPSRAEQEEQAEFEREWERVIAEAQEALNAIGRRDTSQCGELHSNSLELALARLGSCSPGRVH